MTAFTTMWSSLSLEEAKRKMDSDDILVTNHSDKVENLKRFDTLNVRVTEAYTLRFS